MNDQKGIKEPYSISAFGKDVAKYSRIGDVVSKKPEVGHTEVKIITHIVDFDALEQEWKELALEIDTHVFRLLNGTEYDGSILALTKNCTLWQSLQEKIWRVSPPFLKMM